MPGCLGDCLAQGAPGDGVCQAGLNCLEHGFDGGDCLAPGCGTALFFSEYVEGLSNSKGLEIYNPTGSPVDLSDYAIWKIANGGLWIDDAMVTWLEGSLASDDVHVFCHTGLSPQTPGVCDQASGGNPMNFNGNDALGLVHKGVLIDVIGAEGEDPGAGWMIGEESSATKDHILVRDPAVTAGDPLWQSALSTWTVLGDDATDGLGAHVVTIPCDPSNAPTSVAD